MMRAMWAAAAVAFGVTGGRAADNDHAIPADAKAILDQADTLELYSLDPNVTKDPPKDAFHGYKVLGKTALPNAEARKALVKEFEEGVSGYQGAGAKCFVPRHGLRATRDGKTADFVICFECMRVQAVVGKGAEKHFLVSTTPAKAFNKVLADARVPLPEQPKK